MKKTGSRFTGKNTEMMPDRENYWDCFMEFPRVMYLLYKPSA